VGPANSLQVSRLENNSWPGTTFTGDTYLRLYGPSTTQVAASDNGCFNGYASRLTFTSITSGTYQIREGCYFTYSCSGTVDWTIQ